MLWPEFFGPTNRALSPIADDEETINLYLQPRDAGSPKSPVGMFGTPGCTPFWRLPDAPVRAAFQQDGRQFAVAGSTFYELFADGTFDDYPFTPTSIEGATISSNGSDGNQLFIVASGRGFIFDLLADTFTPIADSDFPQGAARMGGFLDGRFFVLQVGTDIFQWSALEDGTDWDSFDFAKSNQSSDISQALIINQRQIWLFGSQTTSVWAPTGDPLFPYAPIGGVFIQQGIEAAFSGQPLGGVLYWLGQNEQGGRVVYRASGYTPQRISTSAVELEWSRLDRVGNFADGDVAAWTIQIDGHEWYVLYFPTADYTWVFDATASALAGSPVWFKIAHWNPQLLKWFPHVGRCHMWALGKHFIGDRQSGTIYEYSLDLYDELLVLT